jgi:hypothetical protein
MNLQKISPQYFTSKLDPASLENHIDVYGDQIKGWFLSFARQMHRDEHAGFAALQIVFSYFEGYSIYSKGEDSRGKSQEYFRDGVLSVFPELETYQDGRCGFFHSGITRKRFLLRDSNPGESIIRFGADPETTTRVVQIFIDRRQFIDRVCDHFDGYIAKLRNPNETQLRLNFERAVKLLHGNEAVGNRHPCT